MKAILEFNLDEPEDKDLYAIHFKAVQLHIAYEEFSHFLMRIDKHEKFTDEQNKIIEKISNKFIETFCDV